MASKKKDETASVEECPSGEHQPHDREVDGKTVTVCGKCNASL